MLSKCVSCGQRVEVAGDETKHYVPKEASETAREIVGLINNKRKKALGVENARTHIYLQQLIREIKETYIGE